MNEKDTLYNWLQMKIVWEARPEDMAAKNTFDFFLEILEEDHQLSELSVRLEDDTMYTISYVKDGQSLDQKFLRETVEQLLEDINSNPKYNE